MSLADDILSHLVECHLHPARLSGKTHLELRAGDIHRELGLTSRMPAVCSAMEGRKLLTEAGVRICQRRGPEKGSNVFVTYELAPAQDPAPPPQKQPLSKHTNAGKERSSQTSTALPRDSIDLAGALVLVSCTKEKQAAACQARELYTSTFFRLARQLVERQKADWLILSAKYGLLNPEETVAPYELTLNSMPVAQRRAWADQVLAELLPVAKSHDRVIFLAGQKYREFLVPALIREGIPCDTPMAHLRQGEQLAWLGAQ